MGAGVLEYVLGGGDGCGCGGVRGWVMGVSGVASLSSLHCMCVKFFVAVSSDVNEV